MHPGVSVCNVGTSLRDVSLVIKTLSKRAESTSLQLGGLCNIIGRTFCFVMVIMLLVFRKFTLNIIILQAFFNKINENRRKKCRGMSFGRNKTQYYVVVKTYK